MSIHEAVDDHIDISVLFRVDSQRKTSDTFLRYYPRRHRVEFHFGERSQIWSVVLTAGIFRDGGLLFFADNATKLEVFFKHELWQRVVTTRRLVNVDFQSSPMKLDFDISGCSIELNFGSPVDSKPMGIGDMERRLSDEIRELERFAPRYEALLKEKRDMLLHFRRRILAVHEGLHRRLGAASPLLSLSDEVLREHIVPKLFRAE